MKYMILANIDLSLYVLRYDCTGTEVLEVPVCCKDVNPHGLAALFVKSC